MSIRVSAVQLRAWRDAGLTPPQAAKHAGCCATTLRRIARQHEIVGWARNTPEYIEECRQRARSMGLGSSPRSMEARAALLNLSIAKYAEYLVLRRRWRDPVRALAEVRHA